jgi:predicted transcriptional regulator
MTTLGSRIPRLAVDCTVAGAVDAMAESGVAAALVVGSAGVVGIVTAEGVAAGTNEPERLLIDFMAFEIVRIDPDDDWVTTIRAYHDAATRSVARRRGMNPALAP